MNWVFIVFAPLMALVVAGIVGACLGTLIAYFSYDDNAGWGVGIVTAVVVFVLALGFQYWLSYGTEKTETIRVVGKERIAEGNDGKWVVYGADDQTYENTDAWFHNKSDSTNLQRKLVVGQTYKCKVNGFRFTLISSYKNILSCEPA